MDGFNSSQLSNPNCLEKRVTDAGEVSLLLAISFAVNETGRILQYIVCDSLIYFGKVLIFCLIERIGSIFSSPFLFYES